MHIVSTRKIRDFAEAVLRLEPSGWTSEVDVDQIKVLLAEMLDVVPWSLFAGVEEDDDEDGLGDEAVA